MDPVSTIMGPQDLETINANLRRLDEAESEIRRAELAGLDLSAQKQRAKDARAELLKIRSAYFPGVR